MCVLLPPDYIYATFDYLSNLSRYSAVTMAPDPEGQSINFTKYPSLRKIKDVASHDGREAELLKYIYDHPKLDSELRGSPTAILAVMDEFAAQEDFLINIGSDKATILSNLIHEHKPKVLLELGTYVGYAHHKTN